MSPEERLDRHHADLGRLIARARRELAAGRLDAAAAWAQIAGQHAWMNHSGVFASPELEALLATLGAALPPARRDTAPQRDPRRVLHVLTQAYGTGGSTREVECWLLQDVERRHRVAVTRQGPAELPATLRAAMGGEDAVRLDDARGALMARAERLRRLSAEADAVVLHVHPYDVVPVIAFGAGSGAPPVILMNHADHVFWLGTSVAHAVFHMRRSGRDLATARRGIEPERSIVRARALEMRTRSESRAEAKRRLGVDPGAVVLATAAAATKYRPIDRPGFLDLVVPVLERHPQAQLLAAGPAPEGEWAEAAARTGGRVKALGRLLDPTPVQEAADVYLDSFPFSSLTSLLEASFLATPAVTYQGHPDECAVLGAEVPEIDGLLQAPRTPGELAGVLGRAIEDEAWRRDLGERTREAIVSTHLGDGWRATVSEIYERAAACHRRPAPGPAPRATGALDRRVDAVMERTGFSLGVPGAVSEHLGVLPLRQRLTSIRRLASAGTPPPARRLLPEWVLPPLGAWRRQARAIAR